MGADKDGEYIMQTTTNLGLKKPDKNEYVNITDLNYNADVLDEVIEEKVNSSSGDISETIVGSLDTVEDKFPIPAAGDKIKRFLGKVLTFLKNIKPFEADESYYVAITGSDANGDGTSARPFRTIQRAIDMLPKNLGGNTVTINIESGTYSEAINICGFYSGLLIITGDDASTTIVDGFTEQHKLYDCSARIRFQNLTLKATTIPLEYMAVVSLINCTSSSVFNCLMDGTNTTATATNNRGFEFVASTAEVENVVFSNCETCMIAPVRENQLNPPSFISAAKISGSGNMYGYIMYGSQFLLKDASRPQSTQGNAVGYGGTFVKYSGAVIGSLLQDLTIYVATTGSDTTGDGTSAKPFKTIQFALGGLPHDLDGHTITVNIANGIYDETVVVSGMYNGRLILTSNTPTTVSSNVVITRLRLVYNLCAVIVQGVEVTYSSDAAILSDNNNNVVLQYLKVVTSATSAVGISSGIDNSMRISNSTISNRSIAALFTDSSGYVSACTGTGNGYALRASGSATVHIIDTLPSSTNGSSQINGGQIIQKNGTQISNIISSGLSCAWGTISGGYVRHGNVSGVSMVTILVQIKVNVALNSGQTYTVSGFPILSGVSNIGVASNMGPKLYSWFNNDSIGLIPAVNISSNDLIQFNVTYLTNS